MPANCIVDMPDIALALPAASGGGPGGGPPRPPPPACCAMAAKSPPAALLPWVLLLAEAWRRACMAQDWLACIEEDEETCIVNLSELRSLEEHRSSVEPRQGGHGVPVM
jgi:hypothetical protein